MDIDKMTFGELKQIAKLFQTEETNSVGVWELGKIYLIRTVTMIDLGRLVAVSEQELVLEDAAWIADTGRFSDVLKDLQKLNEIEPFPDGRVIVGRGAIIDAVVVSSVQRSQK